MTYLTRSNFQPHPFHLVTPSPWPLFTSISLLTLTTTGMYCTMLVSNQAVCWNTLVELGQSAGNLVSLDLLGIFRDYTLEYFFCITPLAISPLGDSKFSHYLAGLIEGDGTIIVPKAERSPKERLYSPSVQIVFDSRDLALALSVQKEFKLASVSKKKGINAYVLSINSNEGIVLVISLINGYMRTPKIEALYKLIDWMNSRQSQDSVISKLPLNLEPLGSNPWLSGFIDADGHFSVRATVNQKLKHPVVECKFELSSYCEFEFIENGISFMKKIAKFLEIPDYSFKENKMKNCVKFTIKTQNILNNEILINYLNRYPLFSSNFLNFKDFVLALQVFQKFKTDKKFLTSDRDLINLIKKRMHHNRTIYNWDHLNNFYPLNISVYSTTKYNNLNNKNIL